MHAASFCFEEDRTSPMNDEATLIKSEGIDSTEQSYAISKKKKKVKKIKSFCVYMSSKLLNMIPH